MDSFIVKTLHAIAAIAMLGLLVMTSSYAGTDIDPVLKPCGECHALSRPDYDKLGIQERVNRKGSPLFYAGNKYRKGWLVEWLTSPTNLRLAGVYPPSVTQITDDGDRIDPEAVTSHLALDPEKAEQVATALMKLKPFDDLIAAEPATFRATSERAGIFAFERKFGCVACHRDSPDNGGVSGPQLYTAWQRLQPRFISSFIRDPVLWDRYTMMPSQRLKERDILKLVGHLQHVSGETL